MAGVRGLLAGPRWDRAAIERFQLRRLQALVRHAFDRVPYYHQLFAQTGFRPDDIQNLDHLARIPPTSRSDLQSLPVGAIVVPPFIRLRLGDLVKRGPERCPCGAPSTTLAGIRGRVFQRFELPEGRSIHPFALVDPLLAIAPWIRRFQIVQERIDHLRLKLVPSAGMIPTVDQIAELGRTLSEGLGGGVRVEVELLDEIPASPNGKFRLYQSCVAGASDVGA